jgi:methionyl-tRNA synthetase
LTRLRFLGCQTLRVCGIVLILLKKDGIVNRMTEIKPTIAFEEFEKLDVRIGTILTAELVEGSNKLIKLEVYFGVLGKRQILTGLAKWYQPADLVGKQTTFVINLATRVMKGLESQGMIFALGLNEENKPVLLMPAEAVENGEGAR